MLTIKVADCIFAVDERTYDSFSGLNEFSTDTKSVPEFIIPGWTESLEMDCSKFVYHLLCRELLKKRIIPFHGSALKIKNHAHVFIGPSGAGKSTHARLWKETFSDCVEMINDDRPFLRLDEKIYVYGSPWKGKHQIGQNTSAELKSICVIKKGKQNDIHKLTEAQAFPLIIRQCFPFNDTESVKMILDMVTDLIKKASVWELTCLKDRSAAEVAFRAMEGDCGNKQE